MTGRVFNIERYATEDGYGIRTVVFFKGCTMRCAWCANPESQDFKKEVLYLDNKCISCGKCIDVCSEGAISKNNGFGYITDSLQCSSCMNCIKNCFYNARSMMGEDLSIEQVVSVLLKDKAYYDESKGGVTFSGGEPLIQIDFIEELSRKLKDEGIHIVVETCGSVPLDNIKRASQSIDMFYFDLKPLLSDKHKKYTGVSNKQILENISWLSKNFSGEIVVRYVIIPGISDSSEDMERLFEFIVNKTDLKSIAFLPYHRLGQTKYKGLGRKYDFDYMKPLTFKEIKHLKEYEKTFGIKVLV